MNFDLSRLADPEYVSEFRLPAHSDHRWFRNSGEALTGASSYEQCLNGLWKFHYASGCPQHAVQCQQPRNRIRRDIPEPAPRYEEHLGHDVVTLSVVTVAPHVAVHPGRRPLKELQEDSLVVLGARPRRACPHTSVVSSIAWL